MSLVMMLFFIKFWKGALMSELVFKYFNIKKYNFNVAEKLNDYEQLITTNVC